MLNLKRSLLLGSSMVEHPAVWSALGISADVYSRVAKVSFVARNARTTIMRTNKEENTIKEWL